MRIIVSGTEGRRELADFLASGLGVLGLFDLDERKQVPDPAPAGDIEIVVCSNPASYRGPVPVLSVLVTDRRLEGAYNSPEEDLAGVEIIVVEWSPEFGADDRGLEGPYKEITGARKVLVCRDRGDRERAFRKVLDVAISRTDGEGVAEEVPQKVAAALKERFPEGRITCEEAHDLAHELDVPVPVVGRALDLLQIKLTRCQLGCF